VIETLATTSTGGLATASTASTASTPPFNISSSATAYPVYFCNPTSNNATTTPPAILSFPAATNQTSSDNIVCPDCVVQAVKVASHVFAGDLGRRITCEHERCVPSGTVVDADAPINTLKNAVNAMADRLQIVADEVSYVAHETAVNGKLGVQARCGREMKGVWRDFVVNLNVMTRNHLEQVRDIADVSTAIARGDLSKAMTVPVKGETLLLKNTFNTMGKKKIVFEFILFVCVINRALLLLLLLIYKYSKPTQFICIRGLKSRT
jgi:HAMP domain-containing protein